MPIKDGADALLGDIPNLHQVVKVLKREKAKIRIL
jgi:hypothetical protein